MNKRFLFIKKAAALLIAAVLILSLSACSDKKREYKAAEELYNEGSFLSAAAAFESLGDYKDSAEMKIKAGEAAKEQDYLYACDAFDRGVYDLAIQIFAELGDYRDSQEKYKSAVSEAAYKRAVSLMGEGNYTAAAESFSELSGYKDSDALKEQCSYGFIEDLISAGEWTAAGEILSASDKNDPKISGLIESLVKESIAAATPGSSVFIGSFEQDGNPDNGQETIEWLCLDKKDGEALLLSKYALDSAVFNTKHEEVTWEYAALRKYLNGEFFAGSFSDAEKEIVIEKRITCPDNKKLNQYSGRPTQDRLFELCIDEYEAYFPAGDGKAFPTPYALSRGCDTGLDGACWWWTRTNGLDYLSAAYIASDGSVAAAGTNVINDFGTMRPAMWIKTDSNEENS